MFRLLLSASLDVAGALLSGSDGAVDQGGSIDDLIRTRYGQTIEPRLVLADPVRSDVLLQVLEGARAPEAHLGSEVESRFSVWQEEMDLIVLSTEPEVLPSEVWQHEETGYLLDLRSTSSITFPAMRDASGPEWKQVGSLSATDSGLNFSRIVRLLKKRNLARVIFLNGSTLVSEDLTYRYRKGEQTTSERIRRLNLELIDLSMEEGISIIDVDRLIAEIGGKDHVVGPFCYSSEACRLVSGEFLRVAEDIGFFDERPLMPQIGRQG